MNSSRAPPRRIFCSPNPGIYVPGGACAPLDVLHRPGIEEWHNS